MWIFLRCQLLKFTRFCQGHGWDHVGSVHALNPRVGVVSILQTYFLILMFFTCMIMMVLVCDLGISYGSPLILSHLYTQSSVNLKVCISYQGYYLLLKNLINTYLEQGDRQTEKCKTSVYTKIRWEETTDKTERKG